MARVGGIIQVEINGERQDAKGEWTYNLGRNKNTGVVGMDGVHGHMSEPQLPFIEGKITDRRTLDLDGLLTIEDATVTLLPANGKRIVLRNAWYAGDGTVSTSEGEIEARFEGLSADEVGG